MRRAVHGAVHGRFPSHHDVPVTSATGTVEGQFEDAHEDEARAILESTTEQSMQAQAITCHRNDGGHDDPSLHTIISPDAVTTDQLHTCGRLYRGRMATSPHSIQPQKALRRCNIPPKISHGRYVLPESLFARNLPHGVGNLEVTDTHTCDQRSENTYVVAKALLMVSKSNRSSIESDNPVVALSQAGVMPYTAPHEVTLNREQDEKHHLRLASIVGIGKPFPGMSWPTSASRGRSHYDEEMAPSKGKGYISDLNDNDVICGRGKGPNEFIGNIGFRELVKKYGKKYFDSPRGDKKLVARFIVNVIKHKSPPGRFLKNVPNSEAWYEVHVRVALEKTTQALMREIRNGPTDDG